MPPLARLLSRLLPSSWFFNPPSEPRRLSHLKKGFSHLNESNITGPSRRSSNPPPEWYDMEQGSKAFENLVVSAPPNERTHSGLNRELDERGIPSSDRAHQPVIHRQQDFEVVHSDTRAEKYEIARVL